MAQHKTCNDCRDIKTLDKFPIKKHGLHGVASRCKDCNNAITKQYYQKNKTAIRERTKRNRK